MITSCEDLPFDCNATSYKADEYFSDADLLAIAEDISCRRKPSQEKIQNAKLKLNVQAKDNMNLLWWAFLAKDVASFTALVEAGADPTIPLKSENRSKRLILIRLLMYSSENDERYVDMFKAWLDVGGDPNFYAHAWTLAQDHKNGATTKVHRETLLITAATQGFEKIAKLLLEYGADPNYQPPFGMSYPLEYSTRNFKVFKLIYEAGGDWDKIIHSSVFLKEEKILSAYASMCTGIYQRSSQKDRQSFYQVLQFLQDKGHKLPQQCLDNLAAGKP